MLKLLMIASFLGSLVFVKSVSAWQQDVAYDINVTLDTEKHTLEGIEYLNYTNNSPDTLDFVWIHLYPNAFRDRNSIAAKELERMGRYEFSFTTSKERNYIDIILVTADGRELSKVIDGTKMKLILSNPLISKESSTFKIKFKVKLGYGDYGCYIDKRYNMIYWYPKMVVFDEQGWHPDGFHAAGEYYGEFGTYDVKITLPEDMIVAATGELVSPPEEIAMLDSIAIEGVALDSLRKGILERSKIKKKKRKESERKTLHFHAENVHDFAWFANPEFGLIRDKYREVMINVFYRPIHRKSWRYVADYAKNALKYWSKWYGEYPYSILTVADAPGTQGQEFPTLVWIGIGEIQYMRELEKTVIHEVGHQWFYGTLGNNELDEAWLDEGVNTFSEIRYMEEKYGKKDNMFRGPKYLRPILSYDDHYIYNWIYYTAITNSAEKPVLTPTYWFVDDMIALAAAIYSKAPMIVDMLKYLVGDNVFDRIMQEYFNRYKFRHPHTDDFISVAEEVSGKDLDWFFDQWLRTTKTCDYAIKDIKVEKGKNKKVKINVTVKRKGDIIMPLDVLVKTKGGEKLIKRWDGKEEVGIVSFEAGSKPKYVEIDPDNRILEINKWNNRIPRKISFHPIAKLLPSLDSYEIIYGPLASYNCTDRIRLGVWLNGREFIDQGALKGKNNWRFGISHGLWSNKLWYNFNYQTPLYFSKNRIRLSIESSNSWGELQNKIGLKMRFGQYIERPPEHKLLLGIAHRELRSLAYVDKRDWDLGKLVYGDMSYSYKMRGRNLEGHYKIGCQSTVFRSDYYFDKVWVELKNHIRLTREFSFDLRAFAGHIAGNPLIQDEFFLYGSLRPSGTARLIADRKGALSSQERLHIPGDGNLRGYAGGHLHGKVIFAINLETKPPGFPFPIFFDIGNVWPSLDSLRSSPELMFDFGLKLDLDFVEFYFPIWVSHPEKPGKRLAFRWLFEVSEFQLPF